MSAVQKEQKWAEKYGATPGKLAIVGVLTIILVVSAVINLGGGSSSSSNKVEGAASRESRRSPRNRERTTTKQVALETRPQQKVDWPNLSVAEAAAFDPFAKPKFLQPPPPPPPEPAPEPEPETELEPVVEPAVDPQPEQPKPSPEEKERAAGELARENMRRAVVSLSDLGIEMIVSTPEGGIARIGGRELKVGDTIEGLVVTRIDNDGVEVALPEASEEGAADEE